MRFRTQPVLLLLLFVGACGHQTPPAPPSPPAPPREPVKYFEDITERAGISFTHQQGGYLLNLPETMGAGAGLIDHDRDGFPDIFFVQGSGPDNGKDPRATPSCKLLRSAQGARFEEVQEQAGAGRRGWGMACLATDLDNDGYPDLAVVGYQEANTVHLNNGDGTFTESAASLGLVGDRRWASFVSALDYDRNGLLDVYVGRYAQYRDEDWIHDPKLAKIRDYGVGALPITLSPHTFAPQDKTLFASQLPAAYRDVTAQAGVADRSGRGMSAIGADLDRDGWPDLFVANDVSPCGFYRNRGNGTFEDRSASTWLNENRGSMGTALGDYQCDGLLDLVVTHWHNDLPALYSNRSRERPSGVDLKFVDRAEGAGFGMVGYERIGWGVGFLDVNHDAWDDILIINGHTHYPSDRWGVLRQQRATLFLNAPPGRFHSAEGMPPDHPLSRVRVGRGAAFGDLARDGAVDVVVTANNGAGEVWQAVPPAQSWIALELTGTRSNRDGIGARVRVSAGRLTRVKELVCGESYMSSNSRELVFGLAGHTGTVTAQVTWPSGLEERFEKLEPGSYRRLVEGAGRRVP